MGVEPSATGGGSVENFLAQYGVRGMKWGIRKDRGAGAGPTPITVKTKAGAKVKTSGGKRHPASEDAVKAAVSKQKAKKSSTDALSNQELQALVTRMNLEKQYSTLISGRSKGGDSDLAAKALAKMAENGLKTLDDIHSKRSATADAIGNAIEVYES